MYAELNENNELVDGIPVNLWYRSASFTYVEDFKTYTAPRDWFTAWDTAKKASVHIFPMTVNTWDKDRYRQSGDPITYTFDGTTVFQNIPTMPNPEPESLNRYKEKHYARVDGEADSRVATAEQTPTAGEDYTDDSLGAQKSKKRRDNKAKRKNNELSDAEDHLLDHVDQVYDAADRIRDAIEACADYDAVDAVPIAESTEWPEWVPQ